MTSRFSAVLPTVYGDGPKSALPQREKNEWSGMAKTGTEFRNPDEAEECARTDMPFARHQSGGIQMNVKSLLAVAVLATGAAHAGENLLNNGSFSNGTSAWQKVGLASATAVSDDGIGAPSVELATSTSGSSGQGLYQCVAVTSGTSYRLAGYLKRTSAAPTAVTTVGVAVAFYGAPYCGIGGVLGGNGQTLDPDTLVVGNWTPFNTNDIVAPAGSMYALVGVGADGANAAAYTFRADMVFFGLNEVIFEDGFER